MRNNIVSIGADELKYEIREIVAVAKEFGKLGVEIVWENIGDPVQKGEKIPDWIKDIVVAASREDATYAYSPTKGLEATREFLAQQANKNGNVQHHERGHHLLQRPWRRDQQDLRPAEKGIPGDRAKPGLQHALLSRGVARGIGIYFL